jgi:hypothetical protein
LKVSRDIAIAVFLGVLASVTFAAGFQRWVYGDGPQLIDAFLFLRRLWMHVLYIPVVRLLAGGLGRLDPLAPLRAASFLGGGAGVAGTYLLARWFGASPWRAVFAASLAGATPALVFFSTTIEVHALHFGAVSLCACALLRAPSKRFAPSVLLAIALVPVLYLTHKSAVLLAPGWLALALHARERAIGTATEHRELLLLGGAIASAFVASMMFAAWLVPDRNTIVETLDFVDRFQQGISPEFLREAIVLGLGFLTPLAAIGFLRTSGRERLVFAAILVPVLSFFTWYGEATRGGYFASILPFLAVLAARALPPTRMAVPVALVALAGQHLLAWIQVDSYQERFSEEDRSLRAEAVRAAIGESGVIVSFEPTHQPLTLDLPRVREINVRGDFMKTALSGMDPKTSARETVRYLHKVLGENAGKVALDLGLGRRTDSLFAFGIYLDAIESAVTAAFGQAVRENPRFPMIVIR